MFYFFIFFDQKKVITKLYTYIIRRRPVRDVIPSARRRRYERGERNKSLLDRAEESSYRRANGDEDVGEGTIGRRRLGLAGRRAGGRTGNGTGREGGVHQRSNEARGLCFRCGGAKETRRGRRRVEWISIVVEYTRRGDGARRTDVKNKWKV